MQFHLLRGHRHEHVLVDALRQLGQHLCLAPPDHDRCEGAGDGIEIPVTGDAPGVIAHLVLVEQAPGRAQPVPVDELDDRNQLLQPVLQRGAGQHESVGALDALQRPRRDRVPVLDALGFVGDHDVRGPLPDEFEVARDGVVGGDLPCAGRRVLLPACRLAASDHHGAMTAEARKLDLPLMLERRGADDQHAFRAEMSGEYFGGGDRLDGLAEPHVVAEQAAAGPRREECALRLVGVQRLLQQAPQRRAARAVRKRLLDQRHPPFRIPCLRDEIERIVVDAQLVVVAGLREKGIELRETPGRQRPAGILVEQAAGGGAQSRRTVLARPKMHAALRAVAKVDLAVRRLKSPHKRGTAAAPACEPCKREFDVLACPEIVGGEIRAGAVVLARRRSADRDAVAPAARRVGHAVFGKHGLIADVLQNELLLPSELAAQCRLPRIGLHSLGRI